MGYITKYDLKVSGKPLNEKEKQAIETARKEAEKLTGVLREAALAGLKTKENGMLEDPKEIISERVGYDPFEESCKWYDHDKDMVAVSRDFPDTLFELSGEGEESGDIWKKYFLNGKVQVAKAKIIFEEFDVKKLK